MFSTGLARGKEVWAGHEPKRPLAGTALGRIILTTLLGGIADEIPESPKRLFERHPPVSCDERRLCKCPGRTCDPCRTQDAKLYDGSFGRPGRHSSCLTAITEADICIYALLWTIEAASL
jgi:hypothetical protein